MGVRRREQGARTQSVKKSLTPTFNFVETFSFDRKKRSTERFFNYKRCVTAVTEPTGWFGGEETLLGRAEFKLAPLPTESRWEAEVPLKMDGQFNEQGNP